MRRLKIEAIVPAAGRGLRLKSNISKPLILINKSPALLYALKILNGHNLIRKIIVLSKKPDLDKVRRLINIHKINKVKCVAKGGKTRKDSVKRGIALLDKDTDFVLIHDGVRPFVNKEIISRAILKAKNFGAAVCAVRLKPTIKRVKESKSQRVKEYFVEKTLDRDNIWEAQTPQVFRKELILEAYNKCKNTEATDDAFLVERLGQKIVLVEGSYLNIKITTPEDLVFAKAILKSVKVSKCQRVKVSDTLTL